MKKIFSIILACTALISISSCSDSDYTSKYTDPAKTSSISCEKLMTGVFVTGKQYSMATYYRLFTFETYFLGRYAQVLGWQNNKDVYSGMGVGYNNDRWKNFYNMLAQFNLLKSTYESLPKENQTDNKVFLDCAQIYMYDQLQQMVDLWGDIPYSKACKLQLTRDIGTAYAEYDNAEDLYKMMLDDLKTISTELGTMTLSSSATKKIIAQDWVNKGNVSKWIKYANGLRMRIAMRCATQGDLADIGKAALKDIFENNTTMVTSNTDEVVIDVADNDGFEMVKTIGLKDGWETWNGKCNRANQVMLDAMNANTTNKDPRVPVMFDSNRLDGKYVGMKTSESAQAQSDNFAAANYYSSVDSATFSRNAGYINPVISAAEVSLNKAEAIARGYISGSTNDAKAAFIKGVEESINFYYKLNAKSSFRTPVTKPSDDVIAAYAESQWDSSNPIKCICTQEWLNYSFCQMTQAFFNIRRTGYPALDFVSYKSQSMDMYLPADRLEYPSDEVNYNSKNLATELTKNFGGTDTWYKKIFWSKDSGSWFNVISAQ